MLRGRPLCASLCARPSVLAQCAPRALRARVRSLKILAADPIDAGAAKAFEDRGHKLIGGDRKASMTAAELLAAIPAFDGLVVRSGVKVTKEVLAAGQRLKVVGRAGAGTDNIDSAAATRAGVVVMNTPGGNTSAAAELTLSLIMALARQLPQACASLKVGAGRSCAGGLRDAAPLPLPTPPLRISAPPPPSPPFQGGAWERSKYGKGTELRGKTVGVVGLGMIGSDVARRCRALDMEVVGFDPTVCAEAAAVAGVKKADSVDALLAASDFVTLHTPLNDATRNLICKQTLAKCKDGVFIVNCARGGIVHEGDLLEALNSGKVAGAALDVFESEPPKEASKALIAHPRVSGAVQRRSRGAEAAAVQVCRPSPSRTAHRCPCIPMGPPPPSAAPLHAAPRRVDRGGTKEGRAGDRRADERRL